MMKFVPMKLGAMFLSLAVSFSAFASNSACPNHFAGGQAPDLVNPKLAQQTRELCSSSFAVLHSGVARTPLWSAEHLTPEHLEAARRMKRENTFHADDRLPDSERSNLKDFVRSGYDRGHMSPSGDMPNATAQYESFALSNMIPQDPDNNRNLWEGVESAVRAHVNEAGELYVVTGPVYGTGGSLKRMNGRVLIPNQIFKAVYDKKRQQAGVYLVNNAPGMNYKIISLQDLERISGIRAFPAAPQSVQTHASELPVPTPHGMGNKKHFKW
jgi:endonuclease G